MTSWLNHLVTMNDIKKDNTEEKILEAAQTVFLEKGMDGTRMQEIANIAGINKALLHYYFRTKQKLFEAIFKKVFQTAFPKIQDFLTSEMPINEKLGTFIERYIEIMIGNPFLPIFIIKEINRDPDFMAHALKFAGVDPTAILEMLQREMQLGTIKKMDPREIIINILGLSIFPFAARPLLQTVFYDNDKKTYNRFLEERKATVKDFVLNSILVR